MRGKSMEGKKSTFKSIDEYILQFPSEIQQILEKIRRVIKESAPRKDKLSNAYILSSWKSCSLCSF